MKVPTQHLQEIEVWYILPAIRKELVTVLKEKGKTQKEIAVLLSITEAAVSQYTTKKRGTGIIFPQETKDFIKKAALEITDPASAFHQIQKISEQIKNSKVLCK